MAVSVRAILGVSLVGGIGLIPPIEPDATGYPQIILDTKSLKTNDNTFILGAFRMSVDGEMVPGAESRFLANHQIS